MQTYLNVQFIKIIFKCIKYLIFNNIKFLIILNILNVYYTVIQ